MVEQCVVREKVEVVPNTNSFHKHTPQKPQHNHQENVEKSSSESMPQVLIQIVHEGQIQRVCEFNIKVMQENQKKRKPWTGGTKQDAKTEHKEHKTKSRLVAFQQYHPDMLLASR